MNTAIPYGLAFAAVALVLWRTGYRREAEGVATVCAGFVAMAPVVAWSQHWPIWGLVVWTTVATRMLFLHIIGRFTWRIPAVGYAGAAVCMAWLVKSPVALPSWLDYWPTWAGNILAITMAAMIAGRPIVQLHTASRSRIAAILGGSNLRRNERRGTSGHRSRPAEAAGAKKAEI